MELQDYLRVLRKRWRVMVLVCLTAVAMAAVVTALTPKTYAANTQFFVSTSSASNADQLYLGSNFTQERVKSYSQLLVTPRALTPVIDKLGLSATPEQLARQITASIPLDTVLIDVTVTSRQPEQAAAIATALGETLPTTIDDLERVTQGQPSPVKVTLVRQAVLNPDPVSPSPGRNLALGLVLGLMFGVVAALIRENLDTTVRRATELDALSESPVIGTLPFDSEATARPLVAQVDPKSRRAEAFRTLRTNLQFVNVSDPPRSIVITSSIPGEGKTTTTANLALTMAAGGARVCVVEGDLRRPRLLDYLGYEGSVGLTDVLIGRAKFEDVVQQFGSTSLWVLGAGAVPPNPSELLGSTVMAQTLRLLEDRFDVVLIDAPPLLPVTDAAVLSTRAGGAVVVVGAGLAKREQLMRAQAALAAVDAHVLGLVLNRSLEQGADGYGYEYQYDPDAARGVVETQPDPAERLRLIAGAGRGS